MRAIYFFNGSTGRFTCAGVFNTVIEQNEFMAIADPDSAWLLVKGEFDEMPADLTWATFPRRAEAWIHLPIEPDNCSLRPMFYQAILQLLQPVLS